MGLESITEYEIVKFLSESFPQSPIHVDFRKLKPHVHCQIDVPFTVVMEFGTRDQTDIKMNIEVLLVWSAGETSIQMTLSKNLIPVDVYIDKTMESFIGWVSWVKKYQIRNGHILNTLVKFEHKLPNLQEVCRKLAPIGRLPFDYLSLGKAHYNSKNESIWVIFQRPCCPDYSYAMVRGTGHVFPEVIEEIEREAQLLLSTEFPQNNPPTVITRASPRNNSPTEITRAILDGLDTVYRSNLSRSYLVLVNPNNHRDLMREYYSSSNEFSSNVGTPLRIQNSEIVPSPLLSKGSIVFLDNDHKTVHQVEVGG